jgi:uncharacterized membrane protein
VTLVTWVTCMAWVACHERPEKYDYYQGQQDGRGGARPQLRRRALDFQISVEVAAPADVVWSVMSDVERWHEWTPSVRGVRLLDPTPLRVGSRAMIRQPKFPPAMWQVVSLDPGSGFVWKSGLPGMWVYAYHSVESIASPGSGGRTGSATGGATGSNVRTRATLRLHFAGPVSRLLGRLTANINDRYLAMEAAGLKRRSEERAAA